MSLDNKIKEFYKVLDSSFLLYCINLENKTIDKNKCNKEFNDFYKKSLNRIY